MNIVSDGILALAQAETGGEPVETTSTTEQPAGTPGAQPNLMDSCAGMMPMILLMFAVFYFLLIRPQRKEADKQKQFLDRLKQGDRVVMTSGILGRIVALERTTVTVDVGDRTKIRFLRAHISGYQEDHNQDSDSTQADQSENDEKGRKKKSRR